MKGRITINLWRFVFPVMFFMPTVIPSFAQVYQYRNPNGQLCFTNQLSDVPEDQLSDVLEKQPKKPADQNPSEPKKTTDPPTQTPQAENPHKPQPIPIVKDLNEEKADLDNSHARLMKRKKALKKEKQTLKTPEQVREYRKKVTRLNDEISVYKKRNSAFQKKADAYNAAVQEKGEE